MKTSAREMPRRDPVGFAVAVRQQLRLVRGDPMSLRLSVGLVVFLALLSAAGEQEPGTLPLLFIVGAIGALLTPLWVMAIWDREGADRTYHWSLPASRPFNDLARILAGGVSLFVAFVILLVAGFAIGAVTGQLSSLLTMELRSYINFLLAPLLVYLLATPFVLWRHAVGARWWITGLAILAGMALWLPPFTDLLRRAFRPTPMSLGTALFGPFLDAVMPPPAASEAWWPAVALWLGAAVSGTVFTAVFRPADLGRLLRRTR